MNESICWFGTFWTSDETITLLAVEVLDGTGFCFSRELTHGLCEDWDVGELTSCNNCGTSEHSWIELVWWEVGELMMCERWGSGRVRGTGE